MTKNFPKGEDFLPDVPLEDLKEKYARENKAKPKLRLLCAIHRKEGKSLDEITEITNLKRRTVHEILTRFIKRGFEGKDSIKQTGRPPEMTAEQREQLVALLDKGPPYNKTGLWSTREVKELIKKKFGVEYSTSYPWEILSAAGFSIQRPRPRHYKSPSDEEIEIFKKKPLCWQRKREKGDL